jgi:ABC-2 type transport system ATP-binding protein
VLLAENLVKAFDGKPAVEDLSLRMEEGEVVGLLGVNGAGKTTAMNMLLGLTQPDSGKITIFGRDLKKDRIDILRKTNFSSAYTSLPSNLLVWQNMLVFARIYGVKTPKQKIDELLELFEIGDLKKRVTGHLSSGESTRLNLCKALLNDPALLLLDEPTASLDPNIADKVRTTLRRIQKERQITILYTSHNMIDIEKVCDRVVFINHGRIVTEGTPNEVKTQFSQNSLEDVFIRIARSGDVEGV